MGINSRDYIRNDPRGWQGQWITSGCKWLIIINVVVFVLQLIVTRTAYVATPEGIEIERASIVTTALELDPLPLLHGQIWRLVTYAFCHDRSSVFHILFNMLLLFWFGETLERMYGTREFILFYLVAALASALAFLGLEMVLGGMHPMLGASGAVMAVVALYATHFPRNEIYIWGIVRVQIRFLVLFYLIFDLYPVLLVLGGGQSYDNVAHAAHLGGLAFGFAYYRFGWRFDRLLGGLKQWKPPRRIKRPESIRIYEPPAEPVENLTAQVDKILEKIHAHGEASLSEQERDVLRNASERYKGNPRTR
jgi:membrane associated rhomboid family serine protease